VMRKTAERMTAYRKRPGSLILFLLTIFSAFLVCLTLLFIVGYILVKGLPNLKLSLFAWEYTSENVSMLPAIINTITTTLIALGAAVPVGVCAAVYLVEYAKRGSRLVALIRITAETLSGIPSIVYGLFGFLVFFVTFRWGYSLLGGALTLAIMILPLVMRTTEEALLSVPDSYREGSFGLGAGKLYTIFKVVLPSAIPGILAGVILGVGRIVGETAALLYTAGSVAGVPSNWLGSGRTLAVHMYNLLSEGLYTNQSYATALVLLVLVAGINALSSLVAKKLTKR
jgi:phosphate transport system permease protein